MTAEFHTDFDHWLNVINNTLGRIADALESRPCSPASPAPSDGASASSDSTAGSETSGSASASPHTPATPAVPRQTVQGAGPGTTDPSALIRADPKRPVWLKDSMLPLPVGTERVWWSHNMHLAYAFPSGLAADHNSPEWNVMCSWTEQELEASPHHQVYLVPQPAPADFTTPIQPVEVRYLTVDSLPAPNPIIETILGTESAAKAVEQGVADVVEGRTRQVDSLDQLATEAQAEGEHGTAWERWVNDHPPAYEWDLNPKSRTHVKDRFNAFVAAECERAVERAKASSTPSTPRRSAREVAEDVALQLCRVNDTFTSLSAMRSIPLIQAAIERDREGK